MKRIKRIILWLCLPVLLLTGCTRTETTTRTETATEQVQTDTEASRDHSETGQTQEETAAESAQDDTTSTTIPFVWNDNMQVVTFSRKVDGDTAYFLLDGEEIKVRFLAIDTPETVKANTQVQAWGPEASDYTLERLSNATEIVLEWDDNSDRQDKYDRYLAWVWVDGSLLEEELLSLGYAEIKYIYGDYKYLDDLYTVQELAKSLGLGLWGD